MTFAPEEEHTFLGFLDKFRILDEIPWNEELIDESIAAICGDINDQNTDHLWMDFSINKYMRIGWTQKEAVQFIRRAFDTYAPGKVGLVLSLKYESLKFGQQQYAQLIQDPDIAEILVGIDLVGEEADFDPDFYAPIFKDWNAAKKMTRAHVGESCTVENVLTAIDKLQVTNVAHGFRILEKPEYIQRAKDSGITFDLALTSNYITGVVHPTQRPIILGMIEADLPCTIGSDDPTQLGTTLRDEYSFATRLGVPDEALQQIRRKAYDNYLRFRPS
jgi:adenosine deaminase